MSKLRTWLNNLSLKKKIIYYSYAVIIPILFVICAYIMVLNYGEAQTQINESNFYNLKSLSDNTESVMKDTEDLSTYIVINQDINHILKSKSVKDLNKDHQLWSHQSSIQMVEDMMALKGYINTVAIYPENGVNPYLRCTDSSSFMSKLSYLKKSDTYKRAVELKGKVAWRSVKKGGEDLYVASRTDKLVMYREIFDSRKSEKLGFLVIGIPQSSLEKYYNNELENGDNISIYNHKDKTGIVVYNKDNQELFQYGNITEDLKNKLSDANTIQLENNLTDKVIEYKKYRIYIHKSSGSELTICKVAPKLTFVDVAKNIIYMPIMIMIGVLIALLPILWLVSNIVTKPLRKVCNAMGEFQTGDFNQYVEVTTNDEIGQVAECFNMMVTEIEDLINKNYVIALKERESELSLLQAQINPHFLYNTLDSLYWQACNSDNEEMAENIYALSQFFRYVLNEGKAMVKISQEMELLNRYLEIQKMRFVKKIDYHIHVDEAVKDVMIPKLILQPFVENSVVHGLQNSVDKCDITVEGIKVEDRVILKIIDTGTGMSKEQLEMIRDSINNSELEGEEQKSSYAIKNVKERLELKYGNDFRIEIDSDEKKGTIVVLELPLRGGK